MIPPPMDEKKEEERKKKLANLTKAIGPCDLPTYRIENIIFLMPTFFPCFNWNDL
jgi:hypothetical protein